MIYTKSNNQRADNIGAKRQEIIKAAEHELIMEVIYITIPLISKYVGSEPCLPKMCIKHEQETQPAIHGRYAAHYEYR